MFRVAPKSTAARLIVSVLLVTVSAFVVAQGRHIRGHRSATPRDVAQIDSYVREQLALGSIPGGALAIVDGGKVVHTAGFGTADDSGRAMTPDTPCEIGEATQAFTALTVLQLNEAGKLRIDLPVYIYLPWFRTSEPATSSRITILELLTHTSGLSTVAGTIGLDDRSNDPDSMEHRVRGLERTRLIAAPGVHYEASNANYDILGLVVRSAADMRFEDYVRGSVFDALGMEHTFCSAAEARRHGMAVGHRFWFGFPVASPTLSFPRCHLPAGGIVSSASDLGRLLAAMTNGGEYDGTSIASGEDVKRLLRSGAAADAYTNCGMGWAPDDVNGIPVMRISGGTPDFHADLVLILGTKLGIALLMNANSRIANERLNGIVAGVAAILVGEQPPTFRSHTYELALFALAFLLPILQVYLVGRMAILLMRGWERRKRHNGPSPMRIAVSLVGNAALLIFILVYLPKHYQAPPLVIRLYAPDVGALAIVSAFLAIIGMALTLVAVLRYVLRN